MSEPIVVIDGIRELLERDLEKHKALLERAGQSLLSFRTARSHEIKKKKHYNGLVGGEKYDDDALKIAIDQIAVNIQQLSNQCTAAEAEIKEHQHIIGTLSQQLEDQDYLEAQAELYYQEHPEERPNGNEHRLGK